MAEDLTHTAGSVEAAAPGQSAPPASPPGYELLDEVGRGGMGVVFRARDTALGRDVAVKLLAERYPADSPAAQRFLSEARITGQLQHPGIPAVHQVGALADGRPFLAMKLIKGSTLEAILKQRTDASAERGRLLAIFEAVCQAVGYAHAHRVIHRDLKPANVMVGAFGEVQVMDWGLAKVLGEETPATTEAPAAEETRAWTQVSPTPEAGSHTQAGSLVGTPAFIPPEQALGEIAKVNERADVFGLGALLAVILTGKPPYVGDSFESVRVQAARGKLDDCFARLDACGAESELIALCKQCLAFEPSDRPPDAGAVAAAVAGLRAAADERARRAELERVRVEGEQATAQARAAERRKRRRLALGAAAVLAVAAVGGLTAVLAVQRRANADLAAKNAELAEEQARSERRWYAAEMNLAQKAWEHAQVVELQQRLAAFEPQGPDAPDLRGFEWYYFRSLSRLDLLTLRAHDAPIRSVAYSPDGRWLATAAGKYGEPGEVKVWSVATGEELLCLHGLPDLVSCVAFSPDGRRLAAANGGVYTPGEIKIWDAADGRELLGFRAHSTPVRGLAFSPDGRRLASAGGGFDRGKALPGEVKVWDAAEGRELLSIPGKAATRWDSAFNAVAFSPDGRRLAFADGRTVRVCDAATGNDVFAPGPQQASTNCVAYSPDGRQLASGSVEGTVKVWDAGAGQEVLAFHHAAGIWNLAFSPDNGRLAAAGGNSTVKVWDLSAGNEALILRGHSETVSAVAFSPDGWRLASGGGDGVVKIWDATTPAEAVTLSGALSTIDDVAFSPDGRRLAIANSVDSVRVLDTTTGREVLVLRGHGGGVVRVAYDPDGRRIASAGQDRTVRVWDATSGAEILCLRNDDAIIQGLAFSADGRWLATTSFRPARPGRTPSREVLIWNASNGEKVLTAPVPAEPGEPERFAGIAFSPDGKRLAVGAGRDVRVWEAGTDRLLLTLSGHEGPVRCVAYSLDGRRIASAGDDKRVKVWDSATGKELLTLRGHTSPISGLAYSPDGQRIVTTAGGSSRGGERIDEGVKIWDALTGQEIVTLHGAPGQVPRVTFDAGGRRLALSGDLVVTIWEKASLAAELHEERQAASLVRRLSANLPSREAVLAQVRDDKTISEALRQQALDLVEPFWQSRVRAEAETKVYSLLRKAVLRPEIVARLRTDPDMSEPVRQEALALAERVVEGPLTFNQASRAVASRPGAEPAAYQRAEQQAEIVCRLMPFEGSYQTTLAMAQYRLGKYQEALTTLTHADELNQTAEGGSVPADLALLAMIRYQMRDKDRAQASLDQLRETMQKADWARNEEAQRLLKEAEALLAGRASQPEK